MAAFFDSQLDYIFFFYGLAFFLMAQSCFSIGKKDGSGLPWKLLGVFGVLHGAREWLMLAGHGFGGGPVLSASSSALAAASYLFLIEFGRSGLKAVRGSGPGRWALLPFAALACLGWEYGLPGLSVTSRYFIGLPGGVWAAAAFFFASDRPESPGRAPLAAAGAAMALYALASGLVVPDAPFMPASFFNDRVFFETLRVPVQLVRGAAALAVALAISHYGCAVRRVQASGAGMPWGGSSGFFAAGAAFILAAGWLFTDAAGRHAERGLERELLYNVANIAGSVNPERLKRIAAAAPGADGADRARIQEQVEGVCSSYCRASDGQRTGEGGRYCAHVHVRCPSTGSWLWWPGQGDRTGRCGTPSCGTTEKARPGSSARTRRAAAAGSRRSRPLSTGRRAGCWPRP